MVLACAPDLSATERHVDEKASLHGYSTTIKLVLTTRLHGNATYFTALRNTFLNFIWHVCNVTAKEVTGVVFDSMRK